MPTDSPRPRQVRAVMDSNYIPNFKTAFQHFLVHTGGRAVIEEVEKKLSLAPGDVQPSKETLFRYGNTCCAAVFYVLTNMEARVRARRPDPTLPYPTPFCAAVVCVLSSTEARVRGARAPPHCWPLSCSVGAAGQTGRLRRHAPEQRGRRSRGSRQACLQRACGRRRAAPSQQRAAGRRRCAGCGWACLLPC